MKKAILLSAMLFGTIYSACAQYYRNNNNQSDVKFGFGLSSGFATGPVSGSFPEAGGLLFNFEFPVAKSPVSIILSTGYTFYVSAGGYDIGFYDGGFGGSAYYGDGDTYVASFIPVEAGLKVHVTPHVFIEGNAGISFNVNTYSSDYTAQKNAFIYSPGVGYSFPFGFSNRQNLDLSLVYENRPETGGGYSQVAVRAVWNFGL